MNSKKVTCTECGAEWPRTPKYFKFRRENVLWMAKCYPNGCYPKYNREKFIEGFNRRKKKEKTINNLFKLVDKIGERHGR